MRLRYLGFGVSLNPFWWQWGDVTALGAWRNRMVAVGPFRIGWRW